MHIPKTGGSSLCSFLEFQFPLDRICPAHYLDNGAPLGWVNDSHIFKKIPRNALSQFDFFRGHLGWVPRTIFADDEIETITFLRDPVERILSTYGHICRDPLGFPQLSKRWKTIQDFVFDTEIEKYLANQQAKHFCADQRSDQITHNKENSYLSELIGIWAFDVQLSDEKLLLLASNRLNKCAFVGIMEKYDWSVHQLCRQYRWHLPTKLPKINTTDNRIQTTKVSAKVIDKILELNQIDTILYKEACQRSDEKSHIYFNQPAYPEKKLLQNIEFSFSDKVIGSGWHPREKNSIHTYCWSSSVKSTLSFQIAANTANNLSIKICIINSLLENISHELSLTVNGSIIPLTFKQLDSYTNGFFNGIIPNHLFSHHGKLELVFTTPTIKKPCDLWENNLDNRNLGFACQSISINPISIMP